MLVVFVTVSEQSKIRGKCKKKEKESKYVLYGAGGGGRSRIIIIIIQQPSYRGYLLFWLAEQEQADFLFLSPENCATSLVCGMHQTIFFAVFPTFSFSMSVFVNNTFNGVFYVVDSKCMYMYVCLVFIIGT